MTTKDTYKVILLVFVNITKLNKTMPSEPDNVRTASCCPTFSNIHNILYIAGLQVRYLNVLPAKSVCPPRFPGSGNHDLENNKGSEFTFKQVI